MKRLTILVALFTMGAECELTEPCDRYVEYMCDCHLTAGECDQLRAQLVGAEPELQDQCELDLSSQRAEDQDAGLSCDLDTGLL